MSQEKTLLEIPRHVRVSFLLMYVIVIYNVLFVKLQQDCRLIYKMLLTEKEIFKGWPSENF